MDMLLPYILPLKGLDQGIHRYDYQIDENFFRSFEDCPVDVSEIELEVVLDKRSTVLVFDFSFSGWIQDNCDRCLTSIHMPVNGKYRLLMKYGEPEEEVEDEDVVYIPRETSSWSIAQYAYEYILLARPMISVYDCESDENPPCDEDMLNQLDDAYPDESLEEERSNPFMDALKDWDKKAK